MRWPATVNDRFAPDEGVIHTGLRRVARLLLPPATPDLLDSAEWQCKQPPFSSRCRLSVALKPSGGARPGAAAFFN
jgi:hypothetical protein